MSRPDASPKNRPHRFAIGVLIGTVVTLLTLFADMSGLLAGMEWSLYDVRTRWFDSYTPAPSTDVIHINIDDASLERVGRWPWDRSKLAVVVEELERANASVIAFDLLFSEPQEPRFIADDAEQFQVIEDDAAFAEAIARSGDVLLATLAETDSQTGPVSRAAIDRLTTRPYQTAEQLVADLGYSNDEAEYIRSSFSSLLRRAIYERLLGLRDERGELPGLVECRAIILADIPDEVTDTPQIRALIDEHRRVSSLKRVRQFALPAPQTGEQRILEGPTPRLAHATPYFGIVTYETDVDGKVRSIPLWVNVDGRRYPHFSLAAAIQHYDISLDDIEVTANATLLRNVTQEGEPNRQIRIPMVRSRPGDAWEYADQRAMISWPTAAERWEHLYDPAERQTRQMFPIGPLIEVAQMRQTVEHNHRMADAALSAIVDHSMMAGLIPNDTVTEYKQVLASILTDDQSDDVKLDRRHAIRKQVLDTAGFIYQDFEGLTDLSAEETVLRDMLATNVPRLRLATDEAENGRKVIADFERRMQQFNGRICIIGWTATGSIADFLPTSIGERTPGPIIHGALLNAILTGHFITRGPLWLDALAIAITGLLATLVAVRFAPISALVIVTGLIGTAFLANGIVLFDHMNLLVAAAGPTLAGGLAWAAVIVYRLVLEQRERARITKQFKNYVSGDLVDLIVEDPNRIKQGRHELTCMFSDIAGFTTVSEKLGPEQTISLLNEYLRAMTQKIMAGRGTVNKYLGDGIMAFWSAPIDDEAHALNCCRSVLACIHSMNDLQDQDRFKDLPRLFMRVGVCTGPMMVGDCGAPPDRSDYTVIGDSVNLAARLESSNKQFDTQILLSERTHELVHEHMLARPIGRIRVVGKEAFETVYELLSDFEHADDEQRELANMTKHAVNAFIDGEFELAIEHFEQLAERFGHTKLIDLYLDHCRRYLEEGKPDDFRGELVLTQK
jgi:class 3 adenylate cyclase/CHASE2 domain-containing sensor protein